MKYIHEHQRTVECWLSLWPYLPTHAKLGAFFRVAILPPVHSNKTTLRSNMLLNTKPNTTKKLPSMSSIISRSTASFWFWSSLLFTFAPSARASSVPFRALGAAISTEAELHASVLSSQVIALRENRLYFFGDNLTRIFLLTVTAKGDVACCRH